MASAVAADQVISFDAYFPPGSNVDDGGAYLLVAESAADVLTALLDVQEKRDVYAAATRDRPRNPGIGKR